MKPKSPTLADQLFADKTADPSIVAIFAENIAALARIRAWVWAMISVCNYAFFILIPALALADGSKPTLGWLLIPGIILAIVLAAISPKGTV